MAEFDINRQISADEKQDAIIYFVEMFEQKMREHEDELKLATNAEEKQNKAIELLKIDAFINGDQINPEVVAGVINAFGHRSVGIGSDISPYSLLAEAVDRRLPQQNFKLAQYVDIPAYCIGCKTDITTLSKQEEDDFNTLWIRYENFLAHDQSRQNGLAYQYIDALLDRGDLLNCKNLRPDERRQVIERYLEPRCGDKHKNRATLLERINEEYINERIVKAVLTSPDEYFAHEAQYVRIRDADGRELKEYQKIKNAAMRVVEHMPKYDDQHFGREKGLNERFEDLLLQTHHARFKDIDASRQNFLIRVLYLKTAEQDIASGQAGRLSPDALAFVLKQDRQGFWTRKISPKVWDAVKKSVEQSRDDKLKSLYAKFGEAEFLIHRHRPKKPREMQSIARSGVFLKLTRQERENMFKLSEFAAKADLLYLTEDQEKAAIEAYNMVLSGQQKSKVSADQTAKDVVLKIEQDYQKQKAHATRRTQNAEKVDALLRQEQNKLEVKTDALHFVEGLRSLYGKIEASVQSNPPKDAEENLSEEALENIIWRTIKGGKIEVQMPEYGSLPLFKRDAEKQRRKDMATCINELNTILGNIRNYPAVKTELEGYDGILSEQSYKKAVHAVVEQENHLTDLKEQTKDYKCAGWPAILDEKLEAVLKRENATLMPAESRPVQELEHLYQFLEKDAFNQKIFAVAHKEYDAYQKALKTVARERIGVDGKTPNNVDKLAERQKTKRPADDMRQARLNIVALKIKEMNQSNE